MDTLQHDELSSVGLRTRAPEPSTALGPYHFMNLYRNVMEQHSLFTLQCPLDGLVLIKDSLQADGAFLIPYSLRAALQEGVKVAT